MSKTTYWCGCIMLVRALWTICCVDKSFNANVIEPNMSISTDKKELFHYTMRNITHDRNKIQLLSLKTFHVSPLFYMLM